MVIPLYMHHGMIAPKIAITPRFFGENRKPRSTTSRAYAFASTNWFGRTSVGSFGPPAIAYRASVALLGGRSARARAREYVDGGGAFVDEGARARARACPV